jgi:hypothetical protein
VKKDQVKTFLKKSKAAEENEEIPTEKLRRPGE